MPVAEIRRDRPRSTASCDDVDADRCRRATRRRRPRSATPSPRRPPPSRWPTPSRPRPRRRAGRAPPSRGRRPAERRSRARACRRDVDPVAAAAAPPDRPPCSTASGPARTSTPRSRPTNASRPPSTTPADAAAPARHRAAVARRWSPTRPPTGAAESADAGRRRADRRRRRPPSRSRGRRRAAADAEPPTPAAPAAAAARARDDVVEQPTWQIVAPDVDPRRPRSRRRPPVAQPPRRTARARSGRREPEWPAHAQAAGGLPFLGRPAQPTGGLESLWAESAREVAIGAAGPRARRPRAASSRASAAGCHSPPPPGSAGGAGLARARPRPARGLARSSRTRTQAAPYSSAWNRNDSQASAMNAVASEPASAATPTSRGARNSEQPGSGATIASPATMAGGSQSVRNAGALGGMTR